MNIRKILESLMPFVVIGVVIALLIGLLFMFFYIAMWGLLIGAVLWLIAAAKQYLFPNPATKNEKGVIIEHDDKK